MLVLRSRAVVVTCLDCFSNRWLFSLDIHWPTVLLFFLFSFQYYDVMVLIRFCIFISYNSDIAVSQRLSIYDFYDLY